MPPEAGLEGQARALNFCPSARQTIIECRPEPQELFDPHTRTMNGQTATSMKCKLYKLVGMLLDVAFVWKLANGVSQL